MIKKMYGKRGPFVQTVDHEDSHKAKKMVNFCAVIGCGNRWNRDKGKSFYRLPAIITSQGVQTQTLSEKRRVGWLAAIRRKDIKKRKLLVHQGVFRPL